MNTQANNKASKASTAAGAETVDFADVKTPEMEAALAAARAEKLQKMKKVGISVGKATALMLTGAALTVGYSRFKNRNIQNASDIMGVPNQLTS